MICCRNSAGYGGLVMGIAFFVHGKVSTKTGQLQNAIRDRDAKRAVVETDAHALEATIAHGLERQRRMRWISLQLSKALVGQRLHLNGQGIKRLPEPF